MRTTNDRSESNDYESGARSFPLPFRPPGGGGRSSGVLPSDARSSGRAVSSPGRAVRSDGDGREAKSDSRPDAKSDGRPDPDRLRSDDERADLARSGVLAIPPPAENSLLVCGFGDPAPPAEEERELFESERELLESDVGVCGGSGEPEAASVRRNSTQRRENDCSSSMIMSTE